MDLAIIGIIITIVLGVPALFISRKKIKNFIRSIFPKESIAIFGPINAGKTTLIRYLQGKHLPRQHIRTFGAEKVGKIVFDLTGEDIYFFRSREMYDVGGEHTDQWEAIIKKQNPHGIIYLLDTTNPQIEADGFSLIYDIYTKMRKEMISEKINLRGILILLNKADQWGLEPDSKMKKIQEYTESSFKKPCGLFKKYFDDFQIHFDWSALLPSEYRSHNNDVLREFVAIFAKGD